MTSGSATGVGEIYPVILSGGSGTRLWPLSRAARPKQFLALDGDRSMLLETALRVRGEGFAAPSVICNVDHRFHAAEALRAGGVAPRRIVLEPMGRNTAAAAAVAALEVAEVAPEGVVALLPSDQLVRDAETFRAALSAAAKSAREGRVCALGVEPTSPETGYGYIERGAVISEETGAHAIARFVEKPERAVAETLIAEKGALWNAGVFVYRADIVLSIFEACAPEVLAAARAAWEKRASDLDFHRLDEDAFAAGPSVPFDIAVMERTDRGAVVPARFDWSDVGSWSALWKTAERDAAGNAARGDVVLHESARNLVWAEGSQLVSLVGAEDMVVVATEDAVLVSPQSRAAEVKALVGALQEAGRPEAVIGRTVHRPWGSYTTIDHGQGYLVKRIVVKPGGRLSLQYHHHRAEHWVVVDGVARVTCGAKSFDLGRNQSTYIPIGEHHRLENLQDTPLTMVEVQSGDVLSEDDIVRLEDTYGRA